jgi:hypothetical protein
MFCVVPRAIFTARVVTLQFLLVEVVKRASLKIDRRMDLAGG